jgi:hypothetical protein
MSGSALADSWMKPQTKSFYSSNKQYSFKVVPHESGHGGEGHNPKGTLFGLGSDGVYRSVWTITLDNEVSPVRALVSESGNYVVTFDNWYRIGFGDNVIVIYDGYGRLVKKYGLEDILSEDELEEIPRSVSSRHWGGEHYLDEANEQLVLKIATNRKMPHGDEAEFRELRIALASGNIIKE